MNTSRYSAKLDSLTATIEKFHSFDVLPMAEALCSSSGRTVVAVGSGGSNVAAAYLSRCLNSLGTGRTHLQTPMEFVVESSDLVDVEVWLFSAGANNADIAAAARAARHRGCRSLVLCTRNADGEVAEWVTANGGRLIVVPVAEEKDGYLATHSLLATCTALALASDLFSGGQVGSSQIIGELEDRLQSRLGAISRVSLSEKFSGVSDNATLIVVADTQLRPVSLLLETSLWETAIYPVQVTDMRNFAHGRHSWAHHNAEQTTLLALTGLSSQTSWLAIKQALKGTLLPLEFDYGDCGRRQNLFGLIDGLFWIEAMGASRKIDPAKPGIGAFGQEIFEDKSLLHLSDVLPAPVRQKLMATTKSDAVTFRIEEAHQAYTNKLTTLCSANVGGIVLDYDGTVVSTSARFDPPLREILYELQRLSALGISIGFASGRGGSLGHQLRKGLPSDLLADIIVGYFNGGYIVPANIDIDERRPPRDPVISEVAEWLSRQPGLLRSDILKPKEVQLSFSHDELVDPNSFAANILDCPTVKSGRARVLASGHSFDIIPSTSSKLRVVEELERSVGPGQAVISIGDSGTRLGNDYEFLARDYGVSVDSVCPGLDGCWSLFGDRLSGPEALQKILRSMIPSSEAGGIRIDKASLNLDISPHRWYET